MTRNQAQILESIAALPETERRELVRHLVEANLAAPSFLERMSPEQRAHLNQAIAEAERGEFVEADEVFDRLARRLA